ncbi:Bifunctional xylanase/deacetylase [Fundidesulfovibrio magnetotacticus]|uniref:Bifunctional xylanase/deacetylase n=1 Tax=Fundidesulfovibrio magnetotacticus TaxID=2730080 RepID=A0A6V8LXB7_9BACT|nr:polysaccharide deacetylase family protein [Fundidesulfovibrio magnetotacticus]GFK94297.1 Bifunctional xylanase/deacetylase [Fundidesulfovibrio magnetotacticus]
MRCVLLFLCLFAFAQTADAQQLWTPAELAARPGEERAGRLGTPDPTGPARSEPRLALPPLPQNLRGSIRRVDTGGEKLVALTFDLCELSDQRAGYDGALVDVLRAHGAAATFFLSGRWMRSHPERTLQLMADPRFEIGSHAWTHGNFAVLSRERMREQLDWTQAQYEQARDELEALAAAKGMPEAAAAAPKSIRVFRFPYGRCRPEALEMLAGMGLAAVQWDVNTMDAGKRAPEAIARDVLRLARPGSIVLAHGNGNGHGTAKALESILPELKARGYRFVTVSDLLASGRAVTSHECFDSRSGDTALYDAIFGEGVTHPRRGRRE